MRHFLSVARSLRSSGTVLSVSESDRRISLSLKSTGEAAGDEAEADAPPRPQRERKAPLKGGLE